MKKYNSDSEHLRDIRKKNYMFKVKNELVSTSRRVATVLIALVMFTAVSTVNAQEPIDKMSIGIGATQDFGVIATVDYISDKSIVGFLICAKDYDDQYSEIPYLLQVTQTSDLTVAVRLGYEVLPKVSLISSTGITTNKTVVRSCFPMTIKSSSKIYTAIDLRFEVINNISFSWGYGTLGTQLTLNYSF